MTSNTVPDITQTNSFISDAKPSPPLQAENSVVSKSAGASAANDAPAVFFDTVSISSQSRQAVVGEIQKELTSEVVKKENARKEEVNARLNGNVFEQAPSKVQFVYNQKGELIVKYMDASNRLVYQIPSELMLFQRESASKMASSVDESV